MSEALSIQSLRTTWPRMSRPRICSALSRASSGFSASLIPPALPRPPVRTCALTTTCPPISSAAARASSGVVASFPSDTGIPKRLKSSLPWYSYRSTGGGLYPRAPCNLVARCQPTQGGSMDERTTTLTDDQIRTDQYSSEVADEEPDSDGTDATEPTDVDSDDADADADGTDGS